MNVALWVIQGLVAAMFLATGLAKLTSTPEELAGRMAWVQDFPRPVIKLIGVAEVLGAAGVIVPYATDIVPWLTSVASGALVLLMAGAIVTHVRRKEPKLAIPAIVLLVLAATVTVGRCCCGGTCPVA
jgi:hypothetical protein